MVRLIQGSLDPTLDTSYGYGYGDGYGDGDGDGDGYGYEKDVSADFLTTQKVTKALFFRSS